MIFLSDVDDTLLLENTTVGVVQHLLEGAGRSADAASVRALAGRRGAMGWGLAALHALTGRDRARPRILGYLAGMERTRVETGAATYVAEAMERAPMPEALARLRSAREAGAGVVLVTSTVEPVASALAARLGTTYRSSVLEWKDGRCTGRLARDLTGRKLEAVSDLLEEADDVTVMTDNWTDRALVARADHRIVVLRRPGHRRRWADLDPEFLGEGAP